MPFLYQYPSVLLRWQCGVYKSWHISHIFIAKITQKTLSFRWFFMWTDTSSQVSPLKQILTLMQTLTRFISVNLGLNHIQADTRRNNNVIVTSKRRHDVVLMSLCYHCVMCLLGCCRHWPGTQSKDTRFVPLMRNMIPARLLTLMHTKSYPVSDKYTHDLKTNILEQIIHVSASLRFVQQTDKGAGRSSPNSPCIYWNGGVWVFTGSPTAKLV